MAGILAELALVSKICTELEKHIGIGDKNLAEFVIHLAKESKYDKSAFSKSLKSNGANFPEVLFESLYNILCVKKKVITMVIILRNHVVRISVVIQLFA